MHEYIRCVENNFLGTSDSTNNTKGKSSGGGFGLGDLLGRMASDEQVETPDMWWWREESDAPMKEDLLFFCRKVGDKKMEKRRNESHQLKRGRGGNRERWHLCRGWWAAGTQKRERRPTAGRQKRAALNCWAGVGWEEVGREVALRRRNDEIMWSQCSLCKARSYLVSLVYLL